MTQVCKTIYLSALLDSNEITARNGEGFLHLKKDGKDYSIRHHTAMAATLEFDVGNILKCRVLYDLQDTIVSDGAWAACTAARKADAFACSTKSPGSLFAGSFGTQGPKFKTTLIKIIEGLVIEAPSDNAIAQTFFGAHEKDGAVHDEERGVIFYANYKGAKDSVAPPPMRKFLAKLFEKASVPDHMSGGARADRKPRRRVRAAPGGACALPGPEEAVEEGDDARSVKSGKSAGAPPKPLKPSSNQQIFPEMGGKTMEDCIRYWKLKKYDRIVDCLRASAPDFSGPAVKLRAEKMKVPASKVLKKLEKYVQDWEASKKEGAKPYCRLDSFLIQLKNLAKTDLLYIRVWQSLYSKFQFDGDMKTVRLRDDVNREAEEEYSDAASGREEEAVGTDYSDFEEED